MIKVLQFADFINRYDFIDTIIQYADTQKFQIDVCVRNDKSNIAAPVFPPHSRFQMIAGNSRKDLIPAARKLSKLLRDWEIDILHTHHYDQAVIGWLATKFYPKTKFIFGRHYSDLVRSLSGLKRSFYLGLEQRINYKADRIIVPSTYIFDILTKEQGIDGSKIDVVPYGFAAEKYTSLTNEKINEIRQELKLDGRFVAASFGKLTKGKGVNFLADAVVRLKNKIPGLQVLFVGEGEERNYLENIISRYDLGETIKLLGWRTDAMAIMANADIVVQPTLSEAFSQVMGEAMWMGKPLVITDVSGATDIIKTGENGMLVPKADAQALAGAIEKLAGDKLLREKLSMNGSSFVETRLGMEKIIKLYEESYLKALDQQ